MADRSEIRDVQRELNSFFRKHLKGFGPLIVDGDFGPATKRRIKVAKWYLGYKNKDHRTSTPGKQFRQQLRHPKDKSQFDQKEEYGSVRLGRKRRRAQRRDWRKTKFWSYISPGVVRFEGTPVAKWIAPYLVFARKHGWTGSLNSGYRSPAYSQQLCYQICGAPTCPGRCAGTTSNHTKKDKPNGAVDVNGYVQFAQIMNRSDAPDPRLFNALGAADPWHFSSTGR